MRSESTRIAKAIGGDMRGRKAPAAIREQSYAPSPEDIQACETITREAVHEAPVVQIVSAHRVLRGVRVTLACPPKNDRRCDGRLSAGRTSARYSIRRGRSGRVLLRGVRASLLRLQSVEKGRFGPKTVLRTLRAR